MSLIAWYCTRMSGSKERIRSSRPRQYSVVRELTPRFSTSTSSPGKRSRSFFSRNAG
jgi:hypothetical protein